MKFCLSCLSHCLFTYHSSCEMTHRFASHCINGQIFYHTKLCLGLVNLKPLVPGHVLVIPKRIVERYADLTTDEVITSLYAAFSDNRSLTSLLLSRKSDQSSKKNTTLPLLLFQYKMARTRVNPCRMFMHTSFLEEQVILKTTTTYTSV